MHINISHPYCGERRSAWISIACSGGMRIIQHGTYGATRSPGLASDGSDIVDMLEAALARELSLC